ncbi:MAG: carboxypeptidase regulatory-like domain-containing protein, partial [Acidobacteriia bacterium]|nr:carboxypeptidase regulatory-like domain-containing protein [Terriglobia bacterium]
MATAILLLAFTMPVFAQPSLSITGTLLDPSGSVVAFTAVRLLTPSGAELQADTLLSGGFAFQNLSPGDYELRVSLFGFESLSRKVRLGRRSIAVTLRLSMAARKDEISIQASDRQVTVDTSQNADTISVERSMLDNLPVLD